MKRGLWSWLVLVLVGVFVAACSANLTPSGEGYEIVGSKVTPGRFMLEAGCVLPDSQARALGKAYVHVPSGSGEQVFDCTGLSPAQIWSGVQAYLAGGGSLRTGRASQEEGEGGDINAGTELPWLPEGYMWVYKSQAMYGICGISPSSGVINPDPDSFLWYEIYMGENGSWCVWGDFYEVWIDNSSSYWNSHEIPTGCTTVCSPGGEGGGEPGGGGGGGGGSTTPVSISMTGPDTVYVGLLATFFGTVTYSDGGTAPGSSWFTGNASVLRYDGDGKFAALGAGTVMIKDSILGLNITPAVKSVTVLPTTILSDSFAVQFDTLGPNCNRTWPTPVPYELRGAKAWCDGTVPTGVDSTAILAAAARIRAKGGVCVELANLFDSLWNHPTGNKVHMAPPGTGFTGASGDSAGVRTNGFIVLTQHVTRTWAVWDPTNVGIIQKPDGGSKAVTLQQILAHELDHLRGTIAPGRSLSDPPEKRYHSDWPANLRTPNDKACSDIPLSEPP